MKDAKHQTVLVVDDDEIGRELICRWLQSSVQVMQAGGGDEALERMRTTPIDLVIMDVMMPGLDGYDACRQIKAANPNNFMPVILVTALHGQEDRNQGLEAGADDFLSKPVNRQELGMRVSSLLRIREQEQTIRRQAHALEQALVNTTAHSGTLEQTVFERTDDAQRQNRFINEVIEYLPISWYVVDRNRTVVAWNRTRELGRLGMPRQEAIGRNILELFGSPPRNQIESNLSRVFESGESISFEIDSNENGSTRHYRIHKVPMSVESNEVSHVLIIGEDITEQRRL